MALLQIAEPGQSPMPHQVKRAVGIDLGTTNSLVATVRGGRSAALPDEAGRVMLPSIVNYSSAGEPLVGEAARALGATNPGDTLVSVKRFMGRGRHDAADDAERARYQLADDEQGMVRFVTTAGELSPVQVSLAKWNNCRAAIDIARDARDILGGSGISAEYVPIRHMLNLESVITYEGTETVHQLVVGKELTGVNAFG